MFEQYPRVTLVGVVLLIVLAIDWVAGLLLIPSGDHDFRISHPYYHHDLLPNQSQITHWGEIAYQIHTNSLGFRDAGVREVPISSDKHRILFMGDSHTEGVGVNFEESFTGLLLNKLDTARLEILNAAAVSYSPKLYYYKTRYLLEEVGLDVDEIFVFMDISDIQNEYAYEAFEPNDSGFQTIFSAVERTLRKHSFVFYALRNIYLQHQRKEFYQAISKEQLTHNNTIDLYRTFFSHFDDEVLLNNPQFHTSVSEWYSDENLYQRWGQKGVSLMTEGMQHLVDLCHKHEVALTIMVHPWRNNVMRGEVEDRHVVYWRNFAREKNIGFINLYPVFIHEIPPGEVIAAYFIPFDNHWTAEGHALVADKLFSFIGTRYSTVAADLYHYHKGIVYREQQQNDSALIHFKEAIIRNPAKAIYYYQRGKTYLEAGEYVQAAADFQQAGSLDSTFRQAKLAMEQVEAEQNTNEQTQILQTNPTATAYIVRGKALLVLNRYQSAYEDFEQAFTLEPDNKVPYYYIGYIESNLIKAPREAIKYFDRAIALDTAYVEAYQERAMAFLQMGAKEKAMIDIQQVAQLGGEVDETLWEEVNNLKNNY